MISVLVSIAVFATVVRLLMPRVSVHRGTQTSHFNGKKFLNLDPSESYHGFREFFRWQRHRNPKPWPKWIDHKPSRPLSSRVDGLSFTFINHATVLIQFAGKNFLTDPIWSKRCSPFSWIGPVRHRAPGIEFENLPPIDYALVSHNHYDHMDIPTLRKLESRFQTKIITSLGNQDLLIREKLTDVTELDWWQSIEIDSDLSIIYVPSKHFSSRSLTDRDRTLWGGFIIHSQTMGSVYFAGDTGFGSHFEKIAARFPRIRLSLIPIGAYEPQWFLREFHMTPEDAVRAHMILKSELSLGIHWGTFKLTDEGIDDPLIELRRAKRKYSIDDLKFITLAEGQNHSVIVNENPLIKRAASS